MTLLIYSSLLYLGKFVYSGLACMYVHAYTIGSVCVRVCVTILYPVHVS